MINSLLRAPLMLVLLLICLTYWGNAQTAGCTNTHYKFRWQTTQLDDTVSEFDTNQVIAKFGGVESAIQNTEEQIRQFQVTGTQDANSDAYRNFVALKQELEACRSGGQSSTQSVSSGHYKKRGYDTVADWLLSLTPQSFTNIAKLRQFTGKLADIKPDLSACPKGKATRKCGRPIFSGEDCRDFPNSYVRSVDDVVFGVKNFCPFELLGIYRNDKGEIKEIRVKQNEAKPIGRFLISEEDSNINFKTLDIAVLGDPAYRMGLDEIKVEVLRRKTAYAPVDDDVKHTAENISVASDTTKNQCISIDDTSNPLGSFLVNNCNEKLSVRWYDHGHCGTGCLEMVAAYGRSTITKVTGEVNWAACIYPQTADASWQGSGSYACK
jgi:hypothetical protein